MATSVNVQSPNIRYTESLIEADYEYENVRCVKDEKTNSIKVSVTLNLTFTTDLMADLCHCRHTQ